MIGRAAQGRPWIFREVAHFLSTGQSLAPPLVAEVHRLMLDHLEDHYSLYGAASGVRSARKHIAWYVHGLPGGDSLRRQINDITDVALQRQAVDLYFKQLGAAMDRLPEAPSASAQSHERPPAPRKTHEQEAY
jgi:tRNA-dihydrouridine synthase B